MSPPAPKLFINLLSGVLPDEMDFSAGTDRDGLPGSSRIISMALIGAGLLLPQHFGPLDFISGVLNPC